MLAEGRDVARGHLALCVCWPVRDTAEQVPKIRELPLDAVAVTQICQRHGIRLLSLFRSQLKGTARADSDLDLLVEFFPAARPTLLTMAQIEIELSEVLDGRRIDLRTAADLSPHFRDEVVRMAQVCYAAVDE